MSIFNITHDHTEVSDVPYIGDKDFYFFLSDTDCILLDQVGIANSRSVYLVDFEHDSDK